MPECQGTPFSKQAPHLKSVWPNGWVFIYKLSDCSFESCCCHLEKDFIKLKDRDLKDREEKIKKEIAELFFKPIMVSINDKFGQKINEENKTN